MASGLKSKMFLTLACSFTVVVNYVFIMIVRLPVLFTYRRNSKF